jgi:hypothetical protein
MKTGRMWMEKICGCLCEEECKQWEAGLMGSWNSRGQNGLNRWLKILETCPMMSDSGRWFTLHAALSPYMPCSCWWDISKDIQLQQLCEFFWLQDHRNIPWMCENWTMTVHTGESAMSWGYFSCPMERIMWWRSEASCPQSSRHHANVKSSL